MPFPWSKPSKPDPQIKKRILVIDDDMEIRKTIEVWLEMSGFEYLEARGGRTGWEAIQRTKPDLIIMDVTMPLLSGVEVCRLVRAHEATKTIPIVLLTGRDSMGEVEAGFKAGANDYLTKPFDWDRVHKKICALLGLPEPPKT